MKATFEQHKQEGFTPFTLKLKITKAEEAELLFALFNLGPLCNIMRSYNVDPQVIRDAIQVASGSTPQYGDIHGEMYSKFKGGPV